MMTLKTIFSATLVSSALILAGLQRFDSIQDQYPQLAQSAVLK